LPALENYLVHRPVAAQRVQCAGDVVKREAVGGDSIRKVASIPRSCARRSLNADDAATVTLAAPPCARSCASGSRLATGSSSRRSSGSS
jgi:hypothetical protein